MPQQSNSCHPKKVPRLLNLKRNLVAILPIVSSKPVCSLREALQTLHYWKFGIDNLHLFYDKWIGCKMAESPTWSLTQFCIKSRTFSSCKNLRYWTSRIQIISPPQYLCFAASEWPGAMRFPISRSTWRACLIYLRDISGHIQNRIHLWRNNIRQVLSIVAIAHCTKQDKYAHIVFNVTRINASRT